MPPPRWQAASRGHDRIFSDDEGSRHAQDTDEDSGRRRYRIYGQKPGFHEEEGTDFEALGDGLIAVTPLHFDLTDAAGVEALAEFDLDRLLRPAAQEVE